MILNKLYIAAMCCIIIISGISLIYSKIKISKLENTNTELTNIIKQKNEQIVKSDLMLEMQNKAIEAEKANSMPEEELKNSYDRLEKKYELMREKISGKINEMSSCEERLRAIYEAQEAFCYE